MLRFLFLSILIAFLSYPLSSLALELNYPKFGGFEMKLDMNLNQLIAWFYYFMVGVAGIATFAMLVWGGFKWITSAGNPAQLSEAKSRITSALIGLFIVLASYLILQTINPELLILRFPAT